MVEPEIEPVTTAVTNVEKQLFVVGEVNVALIGVMSYNVAPPKFNATYCLVFVDTPSRGDPSDTA
jgi:hypothetical protein